jgi:MacB-like periplasmic core domain/FtsX-like permease family
MLNKLRLRLRALFFKSKMEEELDEEVRFHLEREIEENIARGMTPEEARYAAIRSFGGVERVKEESRDVRGIRLLEELWQDLRYGARMLMKQPGFTLIAALTLSLGIGANTAIFSLINTVLLRPLAVAHPERLARIYPRGSQGTSFPNYRDLAAGNQVFSELAGHAVMQLNLGQGEAMTRVGAELVTGNYFAALGVRPRIGRTFGTETDGAPGAHPVAVVSHGFWQRKFNADPALVGQTIALNGQKFMVIGIMPEGFRGTWPLVIAPEVWVPVTMQPSLFPGVNRLEDRGSGWFDVFGRLKPGVSLAQAQAAVVLQAKRLAEAYPEQNRGLDPLGRRLRFPLENNNFSPYLEIVGVVKDSKYRTLGEEPQSFFYVPRLQNYRPQTTLLVRTVGEPGRLRSAVRERVLALDKALLVEVATMRENLALALLPARIAVSLLGMLGLLGLSLAVVGIYGVISYAVSQRTSEIGLRMALGAQPSAIFRLVIGQGMKLTMLGIGLGAAAALALTRFLTSLLIGVSPTDPLTFVVLAALFSLVALLACYIPARRATKVDPLVALRRE